MRLRPLAKNLALLAASSALTLGVVEALVRRAVIPLPAFFESSGWWNEQWQRSHRGPVPKAFVKLDPDLGWVPAPDLDRLRYEGAHLSTNAASERGRREHAPGPAGHPRIVAIGDSFMFGQCLEDDETIPARLEERLPGSEVINLGVMGYGHGQMLERLRRDGLPYRPDVVLLGFFEQDLARDRLWFRDYAKPRYALRDGRLVLTHVPVKDPEDYEDAFPRLANYAGMLWDKLRWKARVAEEEALGEALVAEIARTSEAAGARFALVFFPTLDQLEAGPLPVPFLERACREHGWVCIGPGPRIAANLPPEGRPREKHFKCHYSAWVARLIAAETAEGMHAAWPELFPEVSAGP